MNINMYRHIYRIMTGQFLLWRSCKEPQILCRICTGLFVCKGFELFVKGKKINEGKILEI